ncbi:MULTISPECIES: DUF4150 domain-containing protein [unclassified Mesorhizobium]|uniref:DUF4150 domain-containing protein n=1 Tax=unclassified Mesorhizobium TaxID=325217 RepID=UPI00112DF5EA|nr:MULTISPECIES: DUF4150 domain-containing protein [unclassified Mesorhizobium]TPL03037.1 DUF4150 domain-containing protein [Mesorhizobium sp. B2-4-16]TPL73803.1 DUF4150 domain-containing protein [Mesorhizobium sp. B2-4-3]
MTVFANGREISAEAQNCKVIAAFPDTCFTPPENPATPPGVPVPYPDFGVDSDLTSGSGTVKIGDKQISQENSSYYSKCTGDEAGAAAKKGLITSKNTGKVYAQAWSMNVKVESKGVARFGDMATSNHASNPGDTPTMVIVGVIHNSSFVQAMTCAELGIRIRQRIEELEDRHQDFLDDNYDLFTNHRAVNNRHPKPGVGSWDGHVIQYDGQQRNLRRMLLEYSGLNCVSIDYQHANHVAYRPHPPTPRRLTPRGT